MTGGAITHFRIWKLQLHHENRPLLSFFSFSSLGNYNRKNKRHLFSDKYIYLMINADTKDINSPIAAGRDLLPSATFLV